MDSAKESSRARYCLVANVWVLRNVLQRTAIFKKLDLLFWLLDIRRELYVIISIYLYVATLFVNSHSTCIQDGSILTDLMWLWGLGYTNKIRKDEQVVCYQKGADYIYMYINHSCHVTLYVILILDIAIWNIFLNLWALFGPLW